MNFETIARPYAQAIYDHSEGWEVDLEQLEVRLVQVVLLEHPHVGARRHGALVERGVVEVEDGGDRLGQVVEVVLGVDEHLVHRGLVHRVHRVLEHVFELQRLVRRHLRRDRLLRGDGLLPVGAQPRPAVRASTERSPVNSRPAESTGRWAFLHT